MTSLAETARERGWGWEWERWGSSGGVFWLQNYPPAGTDLVKVLFFYFRITWVPPQNKPITHLAKVSELYLRMSAFRLRDVMLSVKDEERISF